MATVRAPSTTDRERDDAGLAGLGPQGDGQDGLRLELLDALERMERTEDGWVEKVAHPAHGDMDHRLQVRLDRLGVPEGAVYPNVRLAPDRQGLRYAPDILVVLPENPVQPAPHADYAGVPDLIIEILSRTTAARDRGEKVRNYAARGVPHYWIADPDTRTVWALRLVGAPGEGGRYVEAWVRPLAEVALPWSPVEGTGARCTTPLTGQGDSMASRRRDAKPGAGTPRLRRAYRVVGPDLEGTVLTIGRPESPADLAVIVRVPTALGAFRHSPLRALAAYCAGKGLFLAPIGETEGAGVRTDPS